MDGSVSTVGVGCQVEDEAKVSGSIRLHIRQNKDLANVVSYTSTFKNKKNLINSIDC